MRDILFKARQCGTNRWIMGNVAGYAQDSDSKVVLFTETIDDGKIYTRYCEPETVCQYIDIRDKTVSRVFEGDLLVANNLPIINVGSGKVVGFSEPKYMEIGYLNNGRLLTRKSYSIEGLATCQWTTIWSPKLITKYYTVVGNINDNDDD